MTISYTPGLKRVLPLTGDQLNQYCPKLPLNKDGESIFYPAIQLIRRVTNYNSWSMDFEVVNWPLSWKNAIIKDIGQSNFNYWKQPFNGQWFPENHPDKFYLCTFPENEIMIDQVKSVPAKGGYYGHVKVLKLNANPPKFANIPFWQMGFQYDMRNDGAILSCVDDTTHLVTFPYASAHPNDDWIFMDYLEDA